MTGARAQRGGFVVGLVVGLLIGLALALGVALYVTKVPVPFVDKVPQRTAEQDAAEAERNKSWDPNAPLAGKPAVRPPAPAGTPPQPAGPAASPAAARPAATASAPAVPAPAAKASAPVRDPAAILAGAAAPPAAASAPRAAAGPLAAASAPDPYVYFLQVGAYSRPEDAEQQRARLAMLGHTAKVTEREQSGRVVYRVRLGPFEQRDEADAGKAKLGADGVEAALVRVSR